MTAAFSGSAGLPTKHGNSNMERRIERSGIKKVS
jgi:hypothetical protein